MSPSAAVTRNLLTQLFPGTADDANKPVKKLADRIPFLPVREQSDGEKRDEHGHGADVEEDRVCDVLDNNISQHSEWNCKTHGQRRNQGRCQEAAPAKINDTVMVNSLSGSLMKEKKRKGVLNGKT